jgi:pantetheine-phosphate adenylyltransferase
MPVALYPGTFDPITFGHIDIARRASKIFRHVVAVIASNSGKNPLFTVDERVEMAREAFVDCPEIEVIRYDGLIVQCLKEYKATTIIRGMRALSDFEYEFQMAFTNRNMFSEAETVFLMPNEKYTYLSSTLVKEIARLGGDVSAFVPPVVLDRIKQKLSRPA